MIITADFWWFELVQTYNKIHAVYFQHNQLPLIKDPLCNIKKDPFHNTIYTIRRSHRHRSSEKSFLSTSMPRPFTFRRFMHEEACYMTISVVNQNNPKMPSRWTQLSWAVDTNASTESFPFLLLRLQFRTFDPVTTRVCSSLIAGVTVFSPPRTPRLACHRKKPPKSNSYCTQGGL